MDRRGHKTAADWPTYLGDNGRRGTTTDALDLPLAKQWTFTPRHAPRPSWPDPGKEYRKVAFDLAFHVASAAGRVYFASSADDQVYCLDAATGAIPIGPPRKPAAKQAERKRNNR